MAIDLLSISKRFGDFTALDDVCLHAPGGSLTALLGPSGCGKSTLLRVVAGLERPDSGEVHIEGTAATGLSPRHRGVGFVFQHYAPFRHMTVRENIAFGLKVRKRPKHEIEAKVAELLELVHLGGWADHRPQQLSGGQRQRMALARALAIEPQVLLLDEPFGALDAQVRRDLASWLRDLHERVSVTTLLVTHDRDEAMELADEIVVLREGRVEQAGRPDELYDAPKSDWVMEFVGPVTRIGDLLARPHDLEILAEPQEGARQVLIERVLRLGFEVRLELVEGGGTPVRVQLSRSEAERLELAPGDIVWVRPAGGRARVATMS